MQSLLDLARAPLSEGAAPGPRALGAAAGRQLIWANHGRDGLYPESHLGPMQHEPTVQKVHHARLNRRRSIVREHNCRNDHVTAVVESD